MGVCDKLYDPYDPQKGLRMALRSSAAEEAVALARSDKHSQCRIYCRLYLIETLEACKTVGDWFYRDVLASVREVLEREAKS